jgi:hypothetical protein
MVFDMNAMAKPVDAAAPYVITAADKPTEVWLKWHRKHSLPGTVRFIKQHGQLAAPSLMPGETLCGPRTMFL